MLGIPLGAVLNDVTVIELINGQGRWGAAKRFLWLTRRWRLFRRRAFRPPVPAAANGRILVTWRSSTARIDELLLPVIEEIGPEQCAVLYETDSVAGRVPPGAAPLRLFDVLPHVPEVWLPEFRRCWPEWKAALRNTCRRYDLPAAAFQRLALELVYSSQCFVGWWQFLEAFRPAAIVTEHDRSARWSCLVLAARSAGIPTFTLQHGVPDNKATGYVPLLADKMFCWGELHRQLLQKAGETSSRLLLGGCPRLSRDIAADAKSVRLRLGLDCSKPVVMLGTSPIGLLDRLRLAELFCRGIEIFGEAQGAVRLHPSEDIEAYANVRRRHPAIAFLSNCGATLDEAMAVADIVAVQSSGLGGDALVKRRSVIVIDNPPSPLEYGQELVNEAGCPKAATAEELAATVGRMLQDVNYRARLAIAAEQYVDRFCAYFSRESARRIAEFVHDGAAVRERAVV